MKVSILLCLIYSAVGFSRFVWDSPDRLDPSRVCRTDQGSCGCCKMIREVHNMTNYMNQTLTEFENKLQETKERFNILKNHRAAFSGAIATDGFQECIGPFPDNELLKYNHVFINLNNGYDPSTGIFTAPFSGVYSITVTAYSDAGAPGSSLVVCVDLLVNSQPIARTIDINRNDQEDQSAHIVALQLQKGETVAVALLAGCFLCDDSSRYNTFSVFLLHATGEVKEV